MAQKEDDEARRSDEAGRIVLRASEQQKTPLGEVLRELDYLTEEERHYFVSDLAMEDRGFATRSDACDKAYANCKDCKRARKAAYGSNFKSAACPTHEAEYIDLRDFVKKLELRLILIERVV